MPAAVPLTIQLASDVVAGDRVIAYDGFGSSTWLEVVNVLPIEDAGEVELSFGPGADYRFPATALIPVARPQAGA